MGQDWKWDGSTYFLPGSSAPYDPYHNVRAHARIRKTNDGEYFWQLTGADPNGVPTFHRLLEECQRDCELHLVERALDGLGKL
ncbi:MAG: hypothetical protein ABSA78_10550 [Candidatus Sulfotelmatobacter sp.]|jgi:hypothetical protein